MVLKELNALHVEVKDKEFIAILYRLVKEKKDLQRRLDIAEKILRLNIPLIEKKEEK